MLAVQTLFQQEHALPRSFVVSQATLPGMQLTIKKSEATQTSQNASTLVLEV